MTKHWPALAEVQHYWNANPAGYAEVKQFEHDRRAFFNERDRQTQLLYPNLDVHYGFTRAKGKHTLELGCGMGFNAQRLAECGARLVAIDLAPNAVQLTRERFALRGLHADCLVADAEHLPFAANAFEMVFSSGVIHHSPDTEAAARELIRILAPGGSATVMVYNRDSIWFWWNTIIVLGLLMWLVNTLPAALQAQLLLRWPHWRHLNLPPGRNLTLNDVIRAGTDFGGLLNPISRVYTRNSARRLLGGLTNFVFTTDFNVYRALDSKPSIFTRLSRKILSWLDSHWGWFLIVKADKP
jgi:SAM-dependent methyltransferase